MSSHQPTAQPSLSIKNLQKHFDGVHAVDGLSLAFAPGKITSIVGPNGSGKSTLVNTLTGIHRADGGEIIIGEKTRLRDVVSHRAAQYGMTRTFQDVRLFEQMPVIDNILVVLTERNIASALVERHGPLHLERAEAALRKVGLWEKRDELAANLSYGQRKLLEIARVLAMVHGAAGGEISIIFFDEPFAGLFPEMIKTVIAVMKDLREAGYAVVLIEHNMDIIRELSDHLIVLDSGKLLVEGNPEQVLARADVIEAYLGE